MEKLIVFALAVTIILGTYWVIWLIYGAVVPYFWPTGPVNLISPDFWPFVGAMFIVSLIGKMLFGRK